MKLPKFLSGILLAGAGCALGQVPFLQPVSVYLVKSGLTLASYGLAAKAVRAYKAPDGHKLVALTEHERDAIKELRKGKKASEKRKPKK